MIYVSTGGLKGQSAFVTAQQFQAAGITAVELSGGAYSPTLLEDLKTLRSVCQFQVHNYFPPAKDPYVFNLASQDQAIRKISIEHVKAAIRWAVELDHKRYSFHAGYLLDPDPKELGKRIAKRKLFEREAGLETFLEEVNALAGYAREQGVELLIENNVLSGGNYREFDGDPFLVATPGEAVQVMNNTPDNVNLLIDVAHLKVSAQTLSFDPVDMFRRCEPWIMAYHLSDNDGTRDANESIREDSWFWPYLKKDLDYYSLEIYNVEPALIRQQVTLTADFLNAVE
ncbi:MAG: sugar phosphate isomerase/epimerase family protein [Gammaproteobacteria bacterium]